VERCCIRFLWQLRLAFVRPQATGFLPASTVGFADVESSAPSYRARISRRPHYSAIGAGGAVAAGVGGV
jgi:hypothetical protein